MLESVLRRHGSAGSHQETGTLAAAGGEGPPWLLELTINPAIEPVESKTGWPQAKQLTEGAQPTPQQTDRLKIY